LKKISLPATKISIPFFRRWILEALDSPSKKVKDLVDPEKSE